MKKIYLAALLPILFVLVSSGYPAYGEMAPAVTGSPSLPVEPSIDRPARKGIPEERLVWGGTVPLSAHLLSHPVL